MQIFWQYATPAKILSDLGLLQENSGNVEHHRQTLNGEGRWGTTNDFATLNTAAGTLKSAATDS